MSHVEHQIPSEQRPLQTLDRGDANLEHMDDGN